MDMPQGNESIVFSALSDAELIRLSIDGSDRAFESLLERYHGIMAGYLIGRVPCGVDYEDLLQDVFVQAHQQLPRLRNHNRFGPWLMKITKHRLFDTGRERRRIETENTRLESTASEPAALDAQPTSAQTPAEAAQTREFMDTLEEALGALGEKYRLAVYLRVVEQLDSKEIARQLGISDSAARVRLHRGLKALSEELTKREISPDGA